MILTLTGPDGKTIAARKISLSEFTVVINGNAEWVSLTKELREEVSAMLVDGFRRTREGNTELPARMPGFKVIADNSMPVDEIRLKVVKR